MTADKVYMLQDRVGLTLGGITACCRSIRAYRVTRAQWEKIEAIYESLLPIMEEVTFNPAVGDGPKSVDEAEKK